MLQLESTVIVNGGDELFANSTAETSIPAHRKMHDADHVHCEHVRVYFIFRDNKIPGYRYILTGGSGKVLTKTHRIQ